MSSRLFVLFLLSLSGLGLAGCTSKGGGADAVAAAAGRAGEEGTVRIESTITLKSGDDSFVRHLEGEIDFDERAVRLDVDEYGNEYEAVFDGNELVVRLPGEEWSPAWWADFESELIRSPRRIFSALEDSTGTKKSGTETVRDTKTTRYSAFVESEVLFEATQVTVNDKRDRAPERLTIDAWIDRDGLLRKVAYDFTFASSGDVVSVVVEFWDWGKAPTVEVPEVEDIDALLDSMDLGDLEGSVFGGETCYGDRVAECLGVNPELDAITGDPADCTGETARVCMVPVGFVRRDIVDAIVKFHRETKGIEIVVLPTMPVHPDMVDEDSSQVTEYGVYDMIKAYYGIHPLTASTFIGITPFDMRPRDDGYGWFFGARITRSGIWERDGVFSYFRMLHVEPYDGSGIDDDLVYERVSKYAGRYVAVLFFGYPYGDDINFLNYSDMYGFSDLDSLQPNWPRFAPPCSEPGTGICIVPGEDEDADFVDALRAAAERLETTLGIPVGVRTAGTYTPTKDSWSVEFHSDLGQVVRPFFSNPELEVVGVTTEPFSQSKEVAPHTDAAWPEDGIAVVSVDGAGKTGSKAYEERLYRLLLRAAARTVYGMPLSSDPSSLLYEGVDSPDDLDGLTLPVLKSP